MASYQITLIGSSGVGKTSMLRQLIQNCFGDFEPDNEHYYRKEVSVDGDRCFLTILDFPSEELPTAEDFKQSHGFMLNYAINSTASIVELEFLRDEILAAREAHTCPMVVVGNKCDLDEERQIVPERAIEMAERWKVPSFETSAKLRINVEESFYELVRQIRAHSSSSPSGPTGSSTKTKSGACCLM